MAVDDEEHHSAGTSSDRYTIPEGIEVSPTTTHTSTTPNPATPSSLSHPDCRDSVSSSNLAPPGTQPRRSASNPPPALPPPRRSSHATPPSSQHRSPTPVSGAGRHGQAPLPPNPRRWGAAAKHSMDRVIPSRAEPVVSVRQGSSKPTALPPQLSRHSLKLSLNLRKQVLCLTRSRQHHQHYWYHQPNPVTMPLRRLRLSA
jgi:hypothetical protein